MHSWPEMPETPLEFVENNEPTVTFTLRERLADNTRRPADLTGATVELYVKDSPNVDDADALVIYTTTPGDGITVVGQPLDGVVEVQFTLVATESGQRWYHLDVVRNGKRLTYAFGPVRVRNV